jgi:hypothetical protein
MKKEKANPNRHMGKYTGYELINGEYHLAPLYVEQFDKLTERKFGINNMFEIIMRYVEKDLGTLAHDEHLLWEKLGDDIGINIKEGWTYSDNGVVKKIEDKKEG